MAKAKTVFKVGDEFNRLTILSLSHKDRRGRSFFNVVCTCGTEKVVQGSLMSSGNTKSCGCLFKEISSIRISDIHAEVTAVCLGYRRHAIDRGFEWNLSREEVMSIIFKPCRYCDLPPSNVKRTKDTIGNGLFYSGIDRVDSSKSYNIDNVVPCCKTCNRAKLDSTLEEFTTWAIRLGNAMSSQWN